MPASAPAGVKWGDGTARTPRHANSADGATCATASASDERLTSMLESSSCEEGAGSNGRRVAASTIGARHESSYLVVVPWDLGFAGGVNQVVLNLEQELRRAGPLHPVVLVCDWAYPHPVVEETTYTVVRYRLREAAAPVQSPRAFLAWILSLPRTVYRLHRLLAARRVAVVNIHYPTLSSAVFALMKAVGLLRARLVVSFHGQDAVLGARLRGLQRWLFRALLAKADAITACSRGFADEVQRLFPSECSSVDVIYNGIDPKRMEDEMSSAPIAKVDPRPYILCVSSFVAKKALEVLVQAFVHIREELPGYQLMIAGRSGPELERIRALIEREGLGDDICIWIDVPHSTVSRMMRDASLFVLPSREEPFGVVLLEAGLARLPVVATRVGGVPEIISSSDYGVLVPADDAHALARGMLQLLNDADLSTKLGEHLSEHVRRTFSARAMAARFLQVALGSS